MLTKPVNQVFKYSTILLFYCIDFVLHGYYCAAMHCNTAWFLLKIFFWLALICLMLYDGYEVGSRGIYDEGFTENQTPLLYRDQGKHRYI